MLSSSALPVVQQQRQQPPEMRVLPLEWQHLEVVVELGVPSLLGWVEHWQGWGRSDCQVEYNPNYYLRYLDWVPLRGSWAYCMQRSPFQMVEDIATYVES